ncbi:hypothetical protein AGMMS4956_14190 [Bacteroidia bacterium]|nr:hypothetical protein AGMMS4956_14190 [Bacteroidia bacterium]
MAKEVIISNSKLNSQGFRVITQGIDITQYQRNPILLWQHNRPWRGTTDEVLPIGKMENLRIDGDNLIGTPVFDENDDFAKKIKAKFESGFLKMVSAGLDVVESSDDPSVILQGQRRSTVTKSKLFEVSIVDIGANDDAIALYKDGKMLKLSAGEGADILPEIEFINPLNNIEMKSIALKLGLPETATEAEILAKVGTLQLAAQDAEKLQKEVETQREKAIESEVDNAVKLKKITAEKKAHFVTLGKTAGLDSLTATLECMTPALKPTDVIAPGTSLASTGGYKKLSDVPDDKRIELRRDDLDTYKALYKAEYGIEFNS